MREIKFRVWDGRKFYSPEPIKYKGKPALDPNGDKIKLLASHWSYVPNTQYIWQHYTGLKDDNGKEIYEGDILDSIESTEVFYPNRMVVEYHGIAFAFVGKTKRDQPPRSEYTFDTVTNSDIETYPAIVIGNIYENPELI